MVMASANLMVLLSGVEHIADSHQCVEHFEGEKLQFCWIHCSLQLMDALCWLKQLEVLYLESPLNYY